MLPDIDAVTRILEETAVEEVLPRFRQLRDGDIREKRPGELVTVVDLAVERCLAARLRDLWPEANVVGEEAAEHDPSVFDHLAGEGPAWVVDPIDGTGNFARGRAVFAMMIALVVGGETAAGWIYDPMGGRMAVAEHAAGARLDGERVRVPPPPRRAGELAGVMHANRYGRPRIAERVRARRERFDARRSLSCAGVEYLRLLRGELHFALFTRLMPWDHAPGTLIYAEAGGCVRLLDGGAYVPRRHDAEGLLQAADAECWRTVYDTLFGA